MRTLKWFSFLLMSALPMMAGSDASVTITYSPVSGTPALSETMLIALGLLLPVLRSAACVP